MENRATYESESDPANINFSDLTDIIGFRELLHLTTDDKSADRPPWTVVTKAVMMAESEVNSYLARRYTVPAVKKLSPTDVQVPLQVWDWTACVLKYKLYRRRPHVPDDVIEDYKECLRKLENAASGRIKVVELEVDSDGVASSDTPETIALVGDVDRPVNIVGRFSQRSKIGNATDSDGFSTS